jgi:integrase
VAYQARGGKAYNDTKATIEAHIRPKLGERTLGSLTAPAIAAWHQGLASAPARLRTALTAAKSRTRTVGAGDEDGHRARRASANRVLTVLKAALNKAYRDAEAASDDAWRRVKPFAKVDAATIRYLTDQEASRLVESCDTDFRKLVTAALLTGCRYGELAALRARDLDTKNQVITLPTSKGGSARKIVLTDEAVGFFNGLAEFKPRDGLLLTRNGAPWTKSAQFRPMRAACAAALITPAISFHILRHTHASRLAMAGVPMAVIASQLGHADLKMTTKHYAHLSSDYVSETIRKAFGNMGLLTASEAG